MEVTVLCRSGLPGPVEPKKMPISSRNNKLFKRVFFRLGRSLGGEKIVRLAASGSLTYRSRSSLKKLPSTNVLRKRQPHRILLFSTFSPLSISLSLSLSHL